MARDDGRHPRLLRALGRADLLILDDWGLEPLDAAARHDLLEILEDRYGRRSTIVTSQLPVDQWHALIGWRQSTWWHYFGGCNAGEDIYRSICEAVF